MMGMDTSGNIRPIQINEPLRPDEVLLNEKEATFLADYRPEKRHEALQHMRALGVSIPQPAVIGATLDRYAQVKARRHAKALARSKRNTERRKKGKA